MSAAPDSDRAVSARTYARAMLETIFFTILVYLFLSRNKKPRRPRTLDGELKQLIQESTNTTAISSEIKCFLLDVIGDASNHSQDFSDVRLTQSERILDRAGPAAFYWMTEIAAQLSILAAAQINGARTNVNDELGESATPEAVVDVVVKIG
jgi:hypothetical protein